MQLYTCDNCHYTFEAEELPNRCPDCGKTSINHKVCERIMVIPCVRPATESEVALYERAQKEIAIENAIDKANMAFGQKLKMLGNPYFGHPWRHGDEGEEVENAEDGSEENNGAAAVEGVEGGMGLSSYPPDPYNLPIHEHNLALILLHYLRQFSVIPGLSDGKTSSDEDRWRRSIRAKQLLERLIRAEADEKLALYKDVLKSFRSDINTERGELRSAGRSEPWHLDYESWLGATPALKTLYAFRQEDFFKQVMGDTPNLGSIKRIDIQRIAESPTDGIERFLTDLYNSVLTSEWKCNQGKAGLIGKGRKHSSAALLSSEI